MHLNYKYAFDEAHEVIHIDQIDKSNKGKYFCVECGNELIARKGEVKVHHFAHKQQVNCNFETYLHKLAKIKFERQYTYCLMNNLPFYFEYNLERTCTTCKFTAPLARSCSLESSIVQFDLTTRYKHIAIEKSQNGFIADVLLESEKPEESIFIEFAVSHKCDIKKIDFGTRIIEIKLSSEDDLDFIDKKLISFDLKGKEYFNFKKSITIDRLNEINTCKKKFHVFLVTTKGKAIITSMSVKNIIHDFNYRTFLLFKVLDGSEASNSFENFVSLMIQASEEGIKIKNCFVCRFSVESNYKGEGKTHLFCKKHKSGIAGYNGATECQYFWRL